MYAPAQHDEVTGLVHYIDEQLTAIRAAAFGLTEEQARETPCRAAVAATDPAGVTVAPPAPWHGIFDARPIHARYYLVHLIEECARHAGHADIIREQIDGVSVPTLVLTLAGASDNDFVQPYQPAPDTLLV